MFKKRQKKSYPPGTFIPMAARVCAIIQLCLAFTILIWNLSEPFAGELFTYKSELLLYQDVMGLPSHAATAPLKLARLERNKERFDKLNTQDKMAIQNGFSQVQSKMQRSFADKLARAFHIVAFEIPPFELAWLVLSFILPIMLLKRVDGACLASWLLPLLAALYALDNRLYSPLPQNDEAYLYPTEQAIVENYLREPLDENIFKQQQQLERGWKIYLIDEWTNEVPSNNPALLNTQAEEGEFNFNIQRLKFQIDNKSKNSTKAISSRKPQESLIFLALYFFWNTYFAYTIWRFRDDINKH